MVKLLGGDDIFLAPLEGVATTVEVLGGVDIFLAPLEGRGC